MEYLVPPRDIEILESVPDHMPLRTPLEKKRTIKRKISSNYYKLRITFNKTTQEIQFDDPEKIEDALLQGHDVELVIETESLLIRVIWRAVEPTDTEGGSLASVRKFYELSEIRDKEEVMLRTPIERREEINSIASNLERTTKEGPVIGISQCVLIYRIEDKQILGGVENWYLKRLTSE